MNTIRMTLLRACLGLGLLLGASAAAWADDRAAIRAAMRATWERPDAPLDVEPVVVVGDQALAGWTQGDRGGRALLTRKPGGPWQVTVCGGDGMKDPKTLALTGMNAATASALAQAAERADAAQPAARLARFASFQGMVQVAAGAQHGPSGAAHAPAAAGDLEVAGAWARATVPGQPTGAGYLVVTSRGSASDRLVGASTPAADHVELHTMSMDSDVMRMRQVDGIEVPAGSRVELKPGGLHLMLMGLKAPLAAGTRVPLELRFEKAGKVSLELNVGSGTAHHP